MKPAWIPPVQTHAFSSGSRSPVSTLSSGSDVCMAFLLCIRAPRHACPKPRPLLSGTLCHLGGLALPWLLQGPEAGSVVHAPPQDLARRVLTAGRIASLIGEPSFSLSTSLGSWMPLRIWHKLWIRSLEKHPHVCTLPYSEDHFGIRGVGEAP